jgi:lipid-binding SYLF domain-containing protein
MPSARTFLGFHHYSDRLLAYCALLAALAADGHSASAATAAKIDENVTAALKRLYAESPTAKMLGEKAKGILVFPGILKGGLIIGAQWGEGALRKGGKSVAYYRSVAASYGLQAGGQKFGYALFFMDDNSLNYLEKSSGWEIGTGPSVVVVDKGAAKSMGTTASREGVFAFIFGQKGLMAGIGIQGSKITRITPDAK